MRRKRSTDSSLELLLDTICNTFGGILFVAILIVVMLRMTTRGRPVASPPVVNVEEHMQLQQEYHQLQAAIDAMRQAASLADSWQPNVDASLATQMSQLRKRQRVRHNLTQEKLETLASVAQRQVRINETSKEVNRLHQQVTEHEREGLAKEADLRSALESELQHRIRTVEYSQIRTTSKQEIQTCLRYGRFYVWHRYSSLGIGRSRDGLNTDEFVVLETNGSGIVTTQIPSAGTVLDDSAESADHLVARLSEFNPGTEYIAICVWPDSYSQFHQARKTLIQLGFEYRLIPAGEDSSFVDQGGQGGDVQ